MSKLEAAFQAPLIVPNEAEPAQRDGNFELLDAAFRVLKRQSDGSWKFAVLIANQ